MKEPWEWDETDLDALVKNNEPESSTLEFKSSKALKATDSVKAEIAKDISAFANSNGGTIIYGIEEDENHRAAAVDDGSDPAEISTEWLEQVIYSRIQPRLDGLRIHEVSLASGKYAYVVQISKGITAHQASDTRYYMRLNFTTLAMEDYQITDVMNRATAPDLVLLFALVNGKTSGQLSLSKNLPWSESVDIDVSIENRGLGVAEYCIAKIYTFTNVQANFPSSYPEFRQTRAEVPIIIGGATGSAIEWSARLGPTGGPPRRWPGIPVFKTIDPIPIDLMRINFQIHNVHKPYEIGVLWRVEAPNMQPKLGQLQIKVGAFNEVLLTAKEAAW